jgi:hypothetical protein
VCVWIIDETEGEKVAGRSANENKTEAAPMILPHRFLCSMAQVPSNAVASRNGLPPFGKTGGIDD